MIDFKAIVKEKLVTDHRRDPQSKHNQIYFLREDIINSLVKYAQANEYTEEQFEQVFDDALSILEDLFSAFEPYRQSTGDCGNFWSHQYINVKKYITEPNSTGIVVDSANGHLDDCVQRYIQQPAMHHRILTSLLLDAYLYNDTITVLNVVKNNWVNRNIIFPSQAYALTRTVMQITSLALVIFIGKVIYENSPDLLTPYVLGYFYTRYKALCAEPAKKLVKEVFNYSVETYTNSTVMYHHEQMSTVLRHAHEKYGIRYNSTIYELVELLKQPW